MLEEDKHQSNVVVVAVFYPKCGLDKCLLYTAKHWVMICLTIKWQQMFEDG